MKNFMVLYIIFSIYFFKYEYLKMAFYSQNTVRCICEL
jgi:hypothetical protein